MQKRLFNSKTIPIALLLFCIAAYGLLIPGLGFYWDDWPMTWFGHVLGPLGYIGVLSSDRPFLGIIYTLTTSVLKLVPYQWQIFGLLTRWLTTWSVYWTLKNLWPKQTEKIAWISILFAIYPGFKQQPISVIYGNGLVLLAAFFLSLGLMIKAIKDPRRYWLFTGFALACYAFCTFSTEYYVGLDLIRPLFIWLVVSEIVQGTSKRLVKSFLHWLPYLVVLAVFLVWRVFIFKFPTYQPMLFEPDPSSAKLQILQLIDRVIQDSIKSGWLAWISTFRIPLTDDFSHTATLLFWIIVVAGIGLTLVYLIKLAKNVDENSDDTPAVSNKHWGMQVTLIGIFTLLVAGWPFWITELPVDLVFPYDRFTLAFMLGACLLVVGLLEWLIKTNLQKIILLSLIVGLSIGLQYQNANTYRREWQNQLSFFWQLTWRAPGLKPGTSLLTDQMPLNYYSDNSLTAPLNWIYAPDFKSGNMPYFLIYVRERLGTVLPALKNNLPMRKDYRAFSFNSTTSQALTFVYPISGCLRILDPQQTNLYPSMPNGLEGAVNISHLDQIIPDPVTPAKPPQEIFGPEPEHTWCYYYEKADLARQQGDWKQVVALGEEAVQKKFTPQSSLDLLLFSDGYAMSGQWQKALDLTRQADLLSHSQSRPKLCENLAWIKDSSSPDPADRAAINSLRSEYKCP